QRAAQPAGVGAAQIHSQDRLVYPFSSALIARNDLAAPFVPVAVGAFDTRPRHRDGGCSQTGAQRALAMPVPIPGPLPADPRPTRRPQRSFQFLLYDDLDGAPDSLPQQFLQRAFSLPSAPAIPLHGVILRYPP